MKAVGTRLLHVLPVLTMYCYYNNHVAVPIKAGNVERLLVLKKEHYWVWKTIGTELGVDVDTLSAIEKGHTDDKDRLLAVVNGANPVPTLEAMTKILESANITNAIAGMIIYVA